METKYYDKVLVFVLFIGYFVVYYTFRLSEYMEPLDALCVQPDRPEKSDGGKRDMTCLLVGFKRICIEDSPPPAADSSEIWSEFIAIDPARSGSSNLLWTLKRHPHVQVGDPALHNQSCCPVSELSFFTNDTLFAKGIEYYKGYFETRKPNVKIAGEKTPSYSDHPMVPYRIRAMLGPNVKLLFTLRDPLEALLSLYSLRHQEGRVNVSTWFITLLEDQRMYEKCLQKQLRKVRVEPQKLNQTAPRRINEDSPLNLHETISKLDWYSAMMLEEMTSICWSRPTDMRGQRERLQHYIYKENLMRWRTVFGDRVLCIWSDEFRANSVNSFNRVLDFLGIVPVPSNFFIENFASEVDKKLQWKRELGPIRKDLCDFLLKRNEGLESICPRMWPGKWEWCIDPGPAEGQLKS